MHSRKSFGSLAKTAMLMLAMAVTLAGVTGNTLAWLGGGTGEIVNTFTVAGVNLTLTETDTGDGDGNPNTNSYQIAPGRDIAKDPKAAVLAGSETCWLFAEITESDNFAAFMSYEIAEGWTPVEGHAGVYARIVEESGEDQTFSVLKDDTVHVKEVVTGEMLYTLTQSGAVLPTLSFRASAIQYIPDAAGVDTAASAYETLLGL